MKCTVAVTSGRSVEVTDNSTAGTGGAINGNSIDWGDGSPDTSFTPPAKATHTYSTNGPFTVQETITGTPASNFGGDGHETDECSGSPVSFGTPPPPPPPVCNEANENKGNCPDEDCSVQDGDENQAPCNNPVVCNEANENKGNCPDEDCSVKDGDENEPPCTTPPPKCTEANEGTDNCPAKCEVTDKNSKGDADAEDKGVKDADDLDTDHGGTCPPPPCTLKDEVRENGVCEFSGASFYSAEGNPMQVIVDASAVNAPSTKKSGNDPLAGDKITNTDCGAPFNACDSVANRDKDKDISDYTWTFTAYRNDAKTNQAMVVETHTVDSMKSPSAAAQFTKTQGDDVVQITLTITEDGEAKTVIATPTPTFPIFSDNTVATADQPGTPTSPGSVIIEPCDHGGLVTAPETIGDTLGDNLGPILAEPNVQGPISSAVEQNTAGGQASGLGNEVACLVSALPGGAL